MTVKEVVEQLAKGAAYLGLTLTGVAMVTSAMGAAARGSRRGGSAHPGVINWLFAVGGGLLLAALIAAALVAAFGSGRDDSPGRRDDSGPDG